MGVSCSASSCTASSPAGSGTVNVTVTTTGGTSPVVTADQFTYQASSGSTNLVPDPSFETSWIPTDVWGSQLSRTQTVVRSGSWALAQTATSTNGGWELDLNSSWYAPVKAGSSYAAGIWVRATAALRVELNLDLLDVSGAYVDSASGPWVTLAANTWTHLTLSGIQPNAQEPYAVIEPDFSRAVTGTLMYWDDMTLTAN